MVVCRSLQATRKWLQKAVVGGDLYHRPLCPFASKPWKEEKLKLVVSDSACEENLLQTIYQELNVLFPTSTPSSPVPDTSLIIAPFLFQNDYRKMIHFSWRILEHISTESHLNEKVQVSTSIFWRIFHPCHCHIYCSGKEWISFHNLEFCCETSMSTSIIWKELHVYIYYRGMWRLDVQVVNFHPKAVHSLYSMNGAEDGCDFSIRSPHPTFHLLREADVLAAVTGPYAAPELIPTRNAVALRKIGPVECEKRFQTLYITNRNSNTDFAK